MAIKDWPCEQRPREKLLKYGAHKLTDVELLAIFLRTGVKGASAMALAHQLITTFGDLRQLLAADKTRFCAIHGLGLAKYAQLQAAIAMSQRYLACHLSRGDAFADSHTTQQFVTQQLCHYQHEVFACLWLDSKNKLIQFDELFHGTINQAQVYPREVLKKGLQHNASAVILAHNHPSGDPTPSQQDIDLTRQLKEMLALVDIVLLDHIIVGVGSSKALAQMQLI